MVKKSDKSAKTPKPGSTMSSHEESTNSNKETTDKEDLYTCVGHFKNDFEALCQQYNCLYTPFIKPRKPKATTALTSTATTGNIPATPLSTTPVLEERSKSSKHSKKTGPLKDEVKTEVESVKDISKVILTTCNKELLKPYIQVAGQNDNDEKFDIITEFYIRGWKVDMTMMAIFHLCWSVQNLLHTIDLWRVGLDEETVEQLVCFVNQSASLNTLYLDGNPMCSEQWHKFIDNSNQLRHLSLRHNNITDVCCSAMGLALSSLIYNQSNSKLVSLNLSGNRITDLGAEYIANGLKRNRTLLFLDLSNNCIGDYGVCRLAQVISKFPLTIEEVIARRMFIWESIKIDEKDLTKENDTNVQPLPTDQPSETSIQSPASSSSAAAANKNKSSNAKPKSAASKKDVTTKSPKDAAKGKRTSVRAAEERNKKMPASNKPDDEAGKKIDETVDIQLSESDKQFQLQCLENPLMNDLDCNEQDGCMYMHGNFQLISLNLSNNYIRDDGILSLLSAVRLQNDMISKKLQQQPLDTIRSDTNKQDNNDEMNMGPGLLRLIVEKNYVHRENEALKNLNELMAGRHPFKKMAPLLEDVSSVAGDSKEFNGGK